MRVVMRIHLAHDFDPLGRHSRRRGIAAKILKRFRYGADRAAEHLGENARAIVLAKRIRAGKLIGRGFVAGLGHDPRRGLG